MNPFSKQKASERYRVRAESNELEMLLDTDGGSLPTEITGLSMDGVGFFLAKDTSEAMQIGESVRMTFYDMHTGLKVHVVGVITEWTEEQNTYLVDVEFTNQSSMGEQLGNSETWRHFNRRQHFRIHPRMSHYRRSTVTLQWRAHEGAHILHDVSAGGLSIRLASQDKLEVPRDRPIKAFLDLPHSGEVLEFTLKFVHEIKASSHRRIGFAVDPVRTAFYPQVEDQLVAAVMEWQRTAIQVASDVSLPKNNPDG